MQDMELLVEETHRRGLRLILDIALNHTATEVSPQWMIG
jgi:alpha-glucosidase/glucan 1,6-alpha-glucosidase